MWDAYVREVLASLGDAMNSGGIVLVFDEPAARWMVRSTAGNGRDIVLPRAAHALLPPPVMPSRVRVAEQVFSPYNIEGVRVPEMNIARDKLHVVRRTHLATAPACDADWPDGASFAVGEPVIAMRRTGPQDVAAGWFLRFVNRPKALVPMPMHTVRQMVNAMRADPTKRHSSLVTEYWPVAEDAHAFVTGAKPRFARYHQVVKALIAAQKRAAMEACMAPGVAARRRRAQKRARPDSPSLDTPAAAAAAAGDSSTMRSLPPSAPPPTCIICLYEKHDARPRCTKPGCSVPVCDGCHAKSRGLCGLCDREAINGDYPCSGCGKLVSLCKYGFPCADCGTHSMCRSCYKRVRPCLLCQLGTDNHTTTAV